MVFFSDQDGKQGIYNCWPYIEGCCSSVTDLCAIRVAIALAIP